MYSIIIINYQIQRYLFYFESINEFLRYKFLHEKYSNETIRNLSINRNLTLIVNCERFVLWEFTLLEERFLYLGIQLF